MDDDGLITNIEAATEVIKATYRSWQFSSRKITVAEATAHALARAGLLADVVFADWAEVECPTVPSILKDLGRA